MIRKLNITTLAKYLLNRTPAILASSATHMDFFTKQNNFGVMNNKFSMSTQALQNHKNQIKSSY
jgi:hypothetical protein